MRWPRILTLVGVAITVLLMIGTVALRASRDRFSPPRPVPGAAGVVQVRNLFVDFYAAKTARGVILFDAGLDSQGQPLDALLSASGASREQVQALFLTHGHFDHRAAAPLLSRARVFSGADDDDLMRGEDEQGRAVSQTFITLLSIPASPGTEGLRDRRDVAVDGEGQPVIAIPLRGHTDGSYAFFFRGVLFAGDALEYRDGTLRLYSPGYAEDRSALARNAELLVEVTKSLPVSVICTGHSGCTPPGRATALLEALVRRESGSRRPA